MREGCLAIAGGLEADDWVVGRNLRGQDSRIQRNQNLQRFRPRSLVPNDAPSGTTDGNGNRVKSLKGGENEAGADHIEQATSSNRKEA